MLSLLNQVICRVPVFSVNDQLDTNWDKLKVLINDSSPGFYSLIEDVSFPELERLDKKTRFTIWKYFNRAKYRQTPFNGFAALILINFDPEKFERATLITISDEIIKHDFIDWSEKENIKKTQHQIFPCTLFKTNSTLYPLTSGFRYIRNLNNQFEIASVSGSPELNFVLDLCKTTTSFQEICQLLKSRFNLTKTEAKEFIADLASLQLVFSDRSPNITGPDFFQRLNVTKQAFKQKYNICERKLISGYTDRSPAENIIEAIEFLNNVRQNPKNNELEDFRNKFVEKYDGKIVPLCLVMDPELGIGYGNLENIAEDNSHINFLNTRREINFPVIHYTDFHKFLLNNILNGDVIDLINYDREVTKGTSMNLPNSLSAIYHLYKNHPVLELTGGCTANALLGRFTLSSTELEKLAKDIVKIEAEANPDIMFFDICYQAETKIDNVNRRKHIYPNELPLLTWSCNSSPLEINDILVALSGREIVLWSQKENKRIIPRIASAYNYSRSDLSVYRFLCDLQHQGLNTNLNLNVAGIFPGLLKYPRIKYKQVIVSPAMWQVPTVLMEKCAELIETKKNRLNTWLREQHIDFIFKAGISDQQLFFNPGLDADIDAFLSFLDQNKGKPIYITEALISAGDEIKSENGGVYSGQFIVSYFHKKLIYHAYTALFNKQRQPIQEVFFPGDEWLYFEIYCHQNCSNLILNRIRNEFISHHKKILDKWFFLRCEHPKSHIRLRLNTKNAVQNELIQSLRNVLKPLCVDGFVTDIQIKTYFRETERYGEAGLEIMEQLFFVDSKYVILLLDDVYDIPEMYNMTLCFMQMVLNSWMPEIDDQIVFTKKMASNFSAEFAMDSHILKEINANYKKLKMPAGIKPGLPFKTPIKEYGRLLQRIKLNGAGSTKTPILADILHMHINRVFYSRQRFHEMVLYQYLTKLLLSKRAVAAFQSE